ncbi:hypothetical protein [Lentibacillus sp. CBA3610]|uniref:hypothetical protein n=1 Tax=Lentibacillus sp. CBA3610 TaxID=2518176 RepID=UPI0020D21867|nr:hypothetical protein [Lentibacillus sp. CBA3610]
MNAYMTNGTLDFLSKLPDKHPDIDFYFMQASSNTLFIMKETRKTSLLPEGVLNHY